MTKVLHTASDVRTDVDHLLREFYDKQLDAAASLDPAYYDLWSSVSRLAFAGGKRMRPYLIILAYEMYDGSDYHGVLPIAAAAEILHLSLLVHDDITDKDTVRYATDNISGEYQKLYRARGANTEDSRHYAESAALLAGDLLLSASHQMILESGLSTQKRLLAHQQLTRGVFEVAAGQLLDMEAGMNRMDETDAFKIAHLKTASYSFVSPLRTGAMLAGADTKQLDRLAVLGNTLGLAFQLSDDLLGVFGDESVTGKSNLTDLQEGKHTYMMQLAYTHASQQQREFLQDSLGRHDLSGEQADAIRQVIIDSGAKALVEQSLLERRQEAESYIASLSIGSDATGRLMELVRFVTRRDH